MKSPICVMRLSLGGWRRSRAPSTKRTSNFCQILTVNKPKQGQKQITVQSEDHYEAYTKYAMCGMVRYGTLRYGTVRYGTIRYGTVRYGMVRRCATLLNTDHRILAKGLAARLQRVRVISPEQTAFVRGRRMGENVLLLQALAEGLPGNSGAVLACLEIKKAYDTVHCAF